MMDSPAWTTIKPALKNFLSHAPDCDQCRPTIMIDDDVGLCAIGATLLRELLEACAAAYDL